MLKNPCWIVDLLPRPPQVTQATTPVPAFAPVPVAAFAKFQARHADLRIHAGGRLFKTQLHVVAEIRASLRSVSSAPAAKDIFKPEEVSKNILKFIEDRLIHAAIESAAGEPRIAKTVILGSAFLRIGKNRVGFRGFPEFFFRFLFFLRVSIRMPLQRRLAVGGLDFIGRGGALN